MDDVTSDIPLHERINWAEAGAYLASSALTLIEPRNLHGWRKLAYWGAVSALTGAATAAVVRRESQFGWYAHAPLGDDDMIDPGWDVRLDPGTFAGVAGVTFGMKDPMLKVDAWMADTLASWGITRPRVAMAALSALAGVGALALGQRRGSGIPDEWLDDEAERDWVEVTPKVRQVVAEMLAKIDEWGAEELRAQFAAARQFVDDEGIIHFDVPRDIPRVIVDHYAFPVYGEGMAGDDKLTLRLMVADGYVSTLEILDEEYEFRSELPEDVTYHVGSPEQWDEDLDELDDPHARLS